MAEAGLDPAIVDEAVDAAAGHDWPPALSTGGCERVARGMTLAGIQPLTGKPWCCHRGWAGNGEPEGEGMADLLESVIEAHRGLDRWKQLDAV